MERWQHIREFMRSHYGLVEDSAEQVALVIEFDDRRKQHISMTPVEALDHSWVVFETRICRQELLDPKEACQLNGKLPVGHLAIDEMGYYVARHTALMDTLDAEEILVPLHALVSVADDLEEKLTGCDMW
jgi:hypothetical protein